MIQQTTQGSQSTLRFLLENQKSSIPKRERLLPPGANQEDACGPKSRARRSKWEGQKKREAGLPSRQCEAKPFERHQDGKFGGQNFPGVLEVGVGKKITLPENLGPGRRARK